MNEPELPLVHNSCEGLSFVPSIGSEIIQPDSNGHEPNKIDSVEDEHDVGPVSSLECCQDSVYVDYYRDTGESGTVETFKVSSGTGC